MTIQNILIVIINIVRNQCQHIKYIETISLSNFLYRFTNSIFSMENSAAIPLPPQLVGKGMFYWIFPIEYIITFLWKLALETFYCRLFSFNKNNFIEQKFH
jgi:hypothetical protein